MSDNNYGHRVLLCGYLTAEADGRELSHSYSLLLERETEIKGEEELRLLMAEEIAKALFNHFDSVTIKTCTLDYMIDVSQSSDAEVDEIQALIERSTGAEVISMDCEVETREVPFPIKC